MTSTILPYARLLLMGWFELQVETLKPTTILLTWPNLMLKRLLTSDNLCLASVNITVKAMETPGRGLIHGSAGNSLINPQFDIQSYQSLLATPMPTPAPASTKAASESKTKTPNDGSGTAGHSLLYCWQRFVWGHSSTNGKELILRLTLILFIVCLL